MTLEGESELRCLDIRTKQKFRRVFYTSIVTHTALSCQRWVDAAGLARRVATRPALNRPKQGTRAGQRCWHRASHVQVCCARTSPLYFINRKKKLHLLQLGVCVLAEAGGSALHS